MSTHASEFWQNNSAWQPLAKHYEQHITHSHPPAVTSNRLAPWTTSGLWNRTAVTYPEYRGEAIP